VTSVICAPLAAPSGLGVLALERHGEEAFADDDIARLEPLLAVGERFLALTEHARSHSLEVGRSTRHIEALRSITEARSAEAVASRLVEAALQLTGAQDGEWIPNEDVQEGSLAAISLEQGLALPQAGITRSAASPLRVAGDPWTRSAGSSARAIPLCAPSNEGGGGVVRLGALCLAGGRPGCLDDAAIGALEPLLNAAGAALARLAALRSAEQAASTDPLTGLANRGALNVGLAERLASSRARGSAVALLLFDVDHFKRINDSYGHPAGDAVLRTIAATLADGVRKDDLAARYGGEEFAIVLSGAPPDVATALAERIRATLASTPMPVQTSEGPLRVTISVGVANAPKCGTRPDELLAASDRALYEAKQSGRNRVAVA
jgi:diguanylate cyclase (GGDEF)-like protein